MFLYLMQNYNQKNEYKMYFALVLLSLFVKIH